MALGRLFDEYDFDNEALPPRKQKSESLHDKLAAAAKVALSKHARERTHYSQETKEACVQFLVENAKGKLSTAIKFLSKHHGLTRLTATTLQRWQRNTDNDEPKNKPGPKVHTEFESCTLSYLVFTAAHEIADDKDAPQMVAGVVDSACFSYACVKAAMVLAARHFIDDPKVIQLVANQSDGYVHDFLERADLSRRKVTSSQKVCS